MTDITTIQLAFVDVPRLLHAPEAGTGAGMTSSPRSDGEASSDGSSRGSPVNGGSPR
jgi:hypothetical protein